MYSTFEATCCKHIKNENEGNVPLHCCDPDGVEVVSRNGSRQSGIPSTEVHLDFEDSVAILRTPLEAIESQTNALKDANASNQEIRNEEDAE